jgi:hypothetical protein
MDIINERGVIVDNVDPRSAQVLHYCRDCRWYGTNNFYHNDCSCPNLQDLQRAVTGTVISGPHMEAHYVRAIPTLCGAHGEWWENKA